MKEIKEKTDNELIAEFMGFYITSDRVGVDGKPDRVWKSNEWPYFGGYRVNHLNQFDTRWDWLMPVVEKIAKIETNDIIHNGEDSYFDSYFPRTFGMINSETKEFMIRINRNPLHQSDALIKATHEAVVEFIKWFNTQESSKLV